MDKSRQSVKWHIGLFGRTRVGKSSVLGCLTGLSPESSPASDAAGFSEKLAEFPSPGPVLFVDGTGLDDVDQLSVPRTDKIQRLFERCDVAVLVLEAEIWAEFEKFVWSECRKRNMACIVIVNKTDLAMPSERFLWFLESLPCKPILGSAADARQAERMLEEFKQCLEEVCRRDLLKPSGLVADLVRPGDTVVLVLPSYEETSEDDPAMPRELTQVQAQVLREVANCGAEAVTVDAQDYALTLAALPKLPGLVLCDSATVHEVMPLTPPEVLCTTFSILFARFKGDLMELVRGAQAIDTLEDGDRVLVIEACTRHSPRDLIGRVKIPEWLKRYTGLNLKIDLRSGIDFPPDLNRYKLVIHCSGCMLNRREMMGRIRSASGREVPITNYGVSACYLHGVLKRALAPFSPSLEYLKLSGLDQLQEDCA